MEGKEVRQKLTELFGSQLRFNGDFDSFAGKLKQGMQDDLITWCSSCKDGVALGSVPPKKDCKDLFVFFRKIGNSIRAVLIKC